MMRLSSPSKVLKRCLVPSQPFVRHAQSLRQYQMKSVGNIGKCAHSLIAMINLGARLALGVMRKKKGASGALFFAGPVAQAAADYARIGAGLIA